MKVPSLDFLLTFGIFMIMGAGVNWVFPTAMFQEIPYLEEHQPEGLCLATYMNLMVAMGYLVMGGYVFVDSYVKKIPFSIGMPLLLVLSCTGCYLAAAVYSITVDNVSLLLYFCCLIGGVVGALSSVIMNPFLTSYDNDFISATRGGGSAFNFLCAIVAFAQAPGSAYRFSVSVYMTIFGTILILPIISYYAIIHYNLGLRDQVDNVSQNPCRNQVELIECRSNPLVDDVKYVEDSANIIHVDEIIKLSENYTQKDLDEMNRNLEKLDGFGHIVDESFQKMLASLLLRDSWVKKYPFLPAILPYMLTVGWVNFNTWGILSSALPFTMAGVSHGDGANALALAYELGAVSLICGDLSTTQFKIPFRYTVMLFTLGCSILYMMAFSLPHTQNSVASGFMITIFAFGRFLEAHMLTSTYRIIASTFPPVFRQNAAKAVGIMDQTSTTFGAIVSTIIISQIASC